MQLTYRGSQYTPTSAIASTLPSEISGTYRGIGFVPARPVSGSHSLNLMYRGAHYRPVANFVELSGLLTTP